VRPEGLGQVKKNHLIGSRTRDLPACSIVPQAHNFKYDFNFYASVCQAMSERELGTPGGPSTNLERTTLDVEQKRRCYDVQRSQSS
jgi:hypothetical protein